MELGKPTGQRDFMSYEFEGHPCCEHVAYVLEDSCGTFSRFYGHVIATTEGCGAGPCLAILCL